MTAITAITAQNTREVSRIEPLAPAVVRAQVEAVVDDIGVDIVKIGMLGSVELAREVSQLLQQLGVGVVLDPVMRAASGAKLAEEAVVEVIRESLLPLASVVTPNIMEAAALTGQKILTPQDMEAAARALVEAGAGAAVITGGHLEGEAVDVVFEGKGFTHLEGKRISSPSTHGTGCSFASAMAVGLGAGLGVVEAARLAKEFVSRAIACAPKLGGGNGPVSQIMAVAPAIALRECMQELMQALVRLEEAPALARFVPEVRAQLAVAPPGATTPEDVVAVAGRITAVGGRMRAAGMPWPGASSHVARVVLAAMGFDRRVRAAMVIRYDPRVVERAKELGWVVGRFSRADEPESVKRREGGTLEWGTAKVVRELRQVPDIIYDEGEVGKEPVIRVLGRDATSVVDKVLALAEGV